ncbi:hypothetical protein GCM10010519_30050 [Streptomyces lactacystinicus]
MHQGWSAATAGTRLRSHFTAWPAMTGSILSRDTTDQGRPGETPGARGGAVTSPSPPGGTVGEEGVPGTARPAKEPRRGIRRGSFLSTVDPVRAGGCLSPRFR